VQTVFVMIRLFQLPQMGCKLKICNVDRPSFSPPNLSFSLKRSLQIDNDHGPQISVEAYSSGHLSESIFYLQNEQRHPLFYPLLTFLIVPNNWQPIQLLQFTNIIFVR